jgi:hypothetical protein
VGLVVTIIGLPAPQVLELPHADHWRRLPPLSVPRALATAYVVGGGSTTAAAFGGGSSGGTWGVGGGEEGGMVAVGGVDEHANRVGPCERVDVPIGFDELGASRRF